MMRPHWLDEIVGENRSFDSIVKTLSSSPSFRDLVQKGIENGLVVERANKEDPKRIGSNYTQSVRATICRGFEQNDLNVSEL